LRISAALILVEIVAEVDDEVEVVTPGCMTIGVEPAKRQVGAGKDCQCEAPDGTVRKRPRAADGRGLAVRGAEAVIIPKVRLAARDGHFCPWARVGRGGRA